MKKYAKSNIPDLKPVTRVELSGEKKRWRVIAVILLLAIGAALLATAAVNLLGRNDGYMEIEAKDSLFSSFFTFNYDVGASGASASAEYKTVQAVYTEALDKYCCLFSADSLYAGVSNIAYINAHPGESIKVDPVLYSALLKMENEGEGRHYLGLSLEIYDALFTSDGDSYAEAQDPTKNEEMRSINLRACEYSRDRSYVRLELLGDNTLRLEVSAEYAEFASTYGLSRYIDLGVFENAFIIDAIAEELINRQMTLGALNSYDGYTRNLDTRDLDYTFSHYAKNGDVLYPVCDVKYKGSIATYAARTYPISSTDACDFYLYASGESAHRFIDSVTGEYRSSHSELLLASSSKDCSSLALMAYSLLVSDSPDEIDTSDVSLVWLDGNNVYLAGDNISLSSAYKDEKNEFIIKNANKD